MRNAVKQGYASAGTDTGHSGSGVDATWALGHPEKVVDFGYRAIHEMTLTAKAIVKAFYGQPAQRSYFAGCSTGGRQALMEAQRFPEDYDGILAGAPSNSITRLLVGVMWDLQATTFDPASYIPTTQLPAVSAAVLAACGARDGLADGILNDPSQCHFDPASLLCHGADSASCLTSPQVAALRKIYLGPHTSAGRGVSPGYLPGGEEGPNGWGLYIAGAAPGRSLLFLIGVGYFANMVYEKSDWDPKSFQIDEALKLAESKTGQALNAIDPNLKPFQARGGKLILYHGWCDAAIPATNTVDYYRTVVAKLGQRQTKPPRPAERGAPSALRSPLSPAEREGGFTRAWARPPRCFQPSPRGEGGPRQAYSSAVAGRMRGHFRALNDHLPPTHNRG